MKKILTMLIVLLLTMTSLVAAQDTTNPQITPENATQLALLTSIDASEFGAANVVAFAPDGSYFFVGSDDGRIGRYSTNGAPEGDLVIDDIGEVLSIDINANGVMIVTGEFGGIALVDLLNGVELFRIEADNFSLRHARFNPLDSSQVATVSQNNLYLFSYDLIEGTSEQLAIERIYAGGFNDLAFSPDGQSIALATNSNEVQIWTDIANNATQTTLVIERANAINTVAMDGDLQTLIASSNNGITIAWNPDTLEELYNFQFTSNAVAYSPGNLVTALASNFGRFALIDTATGDILAEYQREIGSGSLPLTDIAFSPDGRILAISGADGIIELYGVGEEATVPLVETTPEPPVIDVERTLLNASNSVDSANYENAVNFASEVIAVEPENLEALEIRADSYRRLGDYELAIVDYSALIALDTTDNPDFRFYRGFSEYLLDESDYETVIADTTFALENNFSDISWAYNIRGLANANAGNYDAAFEDYASALEISPSYHAVYGNRAFLYGEQLGQWAASVPDRKVLLLELSPQSASSYNSIAWAYVQLEQYQEALGFVNIALEIEPSERNATDTRGWAYLGLGEYDLALADFEQAVELGNSYSYYGLGTLYAELGEVELAIENLELYLDDAGDSANEEAIALLEALQAQLDG